MGRTKKDSNVKTVENPLDLTPCEIRVFQVLIWETEKSRKAPDTLVPEVMGWEMFSRQFPQWCAWAASPHTLKRKHSIEFVLKPVGGVHYKCKVIRIA